MVDERDVTEYRYLMGAGVLIRQEKVEQGEGWERGRVRKSVQYIKALQINKHRSADVSAEAK